MNGIPLKYHNLKTSFLRTSKLCLIFGSIHLAPSSCGERVNSGYSKKIIDHVNKVAVPIYKLFAETQQGTLVSEYSNHRESQYNDIIADLETLKLKIVSRPNLNPALQSTALKCYNIRYNIPCKSISYKELKESPSKKGVDDLIKNFEQLKLSDSKANLSDSEIRSFHLKISIYLDLIETYENILNQ
ncbi:hypothetical protein OX284_012300 [Flavobacterium sp. SUN046]|uniref:hypothetical protein n=1 Tax=Flavobacterium sp. SUN046 TaxID=3002440 RepID=UPI002DBC703E|nr:hypothetical protein [Flavobacterium sp. SUN046]MEC4050215.1 hypothetical protein [Flavobacterium sp. SUN046]